MLPMTSKGYRIESSEQMMGPLLPQSGVREIVLHDRSLAIVAAAKSVTVPYGAEIRVVQINTGEVVFRKTAAAAATSLD